MSKQPNNPAARLLEIINKARSIPGNVSTGDGWAKLFDLNSKDLPEILLRISDLFQLIYETRRAVEELNDYDHQLYLRPIDKVVSAFTTIRFDIEWAHIINQFDETTLYGLSICSDVLSKYSKEQPIDEETIKALLKDVNDLQEDVLKSGLPDELRSFLLEQLEKLRSALLNYRVFGSKRLKSTLESITGAVFLKGNDIAPFWDNPLVKRTIGILTQIANIVTVAQGFQALTNGIQKFLGTGKP